MKQRIRLAAAVTFTWLASMVCASSVEAQCAAPAPGGGSPGVAPSIAPQFSGSVGGIRSPQLLTAPGSWYYNVMLAQQQAQMAARHQMIMAYQKQQKQNARKQASLASRRSRAEQRRAAEEEARERRRQERLAALESKQSTQVPVYTAAR